MRTLHIVTFLLLGIITITACRGSNQATRQLKRELKDAPRWYKKPPSDDKKFLYSVASAKSTRRDMAKEKAVTGATVTMARKLSLKVEALQKRFNEEMGSGVESRYDDAFSNASRIITNQKLTGLSVDKTKSYARKTGQTATIETFVLMKLPVSQARSILENTLSRDHELYLKLQESKAFKELRDDISGNN